MNEGNAQTCPVCKLNDDQIVIENAGDFGRHSRINCPRCQSFTITYLAQSALPSLYIGPKLSAWIRGRNEQGAEVPQITTDTLRDLQKGFPNYSPREKQIKLLENIERMTAYPGKTVLLFPKYDIPLAWASAQEEFVYYINSLIERGLLRKTENRGLPHRTDGKNKIFDSLTFSVAITADGWDYLEERERHIEERTQAFVAMSFSKDLKFIWEGPIYNAITKAGYKPYRVDAEPHSERIDAKIISEIKNSRFVVADVTEQKLGVYFEAGYAIGLGLPVLWCVRKDDLENVHFDTRQYNHIVWETADGLETQLYDFICAIIGKGKEV
jgi:nucleoside 2-deoxyribosyltransferase